MESEIVIKDFIYICTLSDLGMTIGKDGSRMLKLDVVPGEYGLMDFHDGYILTKHGYNPDFKDVTKIFNTRDGDKGLSGTYWCGKTKNPYHMYFFNKYFRFHLHEDFVMKLYQYDNHEEDDYEEWEETDSDSGLEDDVLAENCANRRAKQLIELDSYHNLPVTFYLNQFINENDLCQLDLKHPMKKYIGNVQQSWRVVHAVYGDIGTAVLQKELFDMMGDQAGLAFFATRTANAIGNFNLDKLYKEASQEIFVDQWVNYPGYRYTCKFDTCNCDWRYL